MNYAFVAERASDYFCDAFRTYYDIANRQQAKMRSTCLQVALPAAVMSN